ncbi:MAG TPA: lipid A export permease/ATP-binding protein MsbA [Rubrivivax sp.]|jgi:subfamily B ATP-binding cassette protein MsbA|nr:lipid A export permease/ATP-binding protein MsbA [Rubrivivax sp.]
MPTLLQRFARFAPYFKSGRHGIAVAFGASLVMALTEPLLPAMMKPLIDNGFGRTDIPLWLVPVVLIGLFVLRGAATFIAQYALAWTANQGVLNLRGAMFDRLLGAHPELFTRHTASKLTNILVYEVQQGSNLLVTAVLTVVRESLTLLALLGFLIWLNWKLTLFVGVMFPLVFVSVRLITRRMRRITLASQKATDELAYVIEENVLAWRIVRLHDAAQQQTARFVARSNLLRRLMMKSVAASALMTPVTLTLTACALSGVLVVALYQSRTGDTTVGGFASFITGMLMLLAPIKKLSEVSGQITRGMAALERGVALIDDSPVESAGSHDPGTARGEIELRDVSLRYRDDQPLALDRLNLHVTHGETVALVGPSGAGKTTLVNLLPRFVDPSAGSVLLDGVPLGDWQVGALRRQFALVSQDVVLFNDSVAANVALGTLPDATPDRERVREALRGANLLGFVEGLPQGLDTPIGHNGNQLSGGQRQRLAIARAIFKDAPILILDEATSALDSESERAVQDALERLMKGRTTLVIAHRLSTIENADRVVAMEAGRVVEQGTHAELLAHGGLYARLHAMQFRS